MVGSSTWINFFNNKNDFTIPEIMKETKILSPAAKKLKALRALALEKEEAKKKKWIEMIREMPDSSLESFEEPLEKEAIPIVAKKLMKSES